MSQSNISRITGMCKKTVRSTIKQINRYGTCVPLRQLRHRPYGRKPTIDSNFINTLITILTLEPTIYVDELTDVINKCLNKQYSIPLVRYWMKKIGYTRKIIWKVI